MLLFSHYSRYLRANLDIAMKKYKAPELERERGMREKNV